jgi:hypothetical protein
MRFIRTALLLLSIASCAMSGIAQDQRWRGDIPFSFKIKNQTFSAGVYDISVDTAHGVVSLSNDLHPGEHMAWVGVPDDKRGLATMHFALEGDSYLLISVAAGNWMTMPPHGPHHTQEATVVFPQ